MRLTSDEIGTAVVVGLLSFLLILGISHFDRPKTSRGERFRSALSWGVLFAASSLVAGVLDLPPFLDPPYPTIVVMAICVVVIGGSVLFFRAMLRDGSTDD